MYTSYNDPATNTPTAEPSAPASAAPNTPAMPLMANLHVDSIAPLPPRMGPPQQPAPTSSPAMTAQQQHGSPSGGQQQPGWALDGMKDMHLSGSEPRIYPGMISRRQRTNSLRKSSMHEGDDRVSGARKGVVGAGEAVEEAGEGEEMRKSKE